MTTQVIRIEDCMDRQIAEHDKYLKALIEYLKIQGHDSLAELVSDCEIRVGSLTPKNVMGIFFRHSTCTFVCLPPAKYHLLNKDNKSQRIIFNSLRTVMDKSVSNLFDIKMKV